MRKTGMPWSRGLLAVALAGTLGAVQAMDVDRIEIRSRLGEPLLAEIPVTGASPQDIAQLQAQLASATTFARIGLPRPQGVVAGLQFEVVRGARPLIRVTSTQPVEENFFTFLVQVDGPQGRLVREYSVSLSASPTLSAPVAPQIALPEAAAPNVVTRSVDPANALPPPDIALPASSAPPAVPVEVPPIPMSGDARSRAAAPSPAPAPAPSARSVAAAAPVPATPAPRVAQPAAAPATRPAAPAPAAPPGPGDHVVQAGENLTGIVKAMAFTGTTEQQAMLALLRTNPQAFARGNINLLQRGAVLRKPATAELSRLSPAAAEAMVRLQIEQWRSGNMPEPVLEAPLPPAAAIPPAAAPSAPPIPLAAPSGARLEIAPADGAAGSAAGASGGQAAGAVAAADAVAARYSEVQQMQERIAQLEQAQKEQRRLLELKDAQLAAQAPQSSGAWPWVIAALSLLVAAIGLWRGKGGQGPGRVATRLAARVRSDAAGKSSNASS